MAEVELDPDGVSGDVSPSIFPFPANVAIKPVPVYTTRTRFVPRSVMNKLPYASSAAPVGKLSAASLASQPSPEKPEIGRGL